MTRKERRNLSKGEKKKNNNNKERNRTRRRDGVTFFRKDRNHIDIPQIPVI